MSKAIKKCNTPATLVVDFKVDKTRRSQLIQFISVVFPAVLFFLGLYLLLVPVNMSRFAIESMPILLGVLSIFLAKTYTYFFQKANYLLVGIGVLFLIIIIIFHQSLINGFLQLVNEWLQTRGETKGVYYFSFKTSASQRDRLLFLSLGGTLLGLWSFVIAQSRNKLLLLLTWLLLLTYLLITKMPLTIVAIATLIGSTVLLSQTEISRPNKSVKVDSSQATSSLMGVSLACLLLVITYLLLVNSFVNEVPAISWVKNKADQVITNLRYEKKRQPVLPRGDLREYQETRSDQEQLEVTMSQAEPLYLKSFVGARFANNQWLDLSTKERYDGGPLFYWLWKDNFSSFSQLSDLNQLISNKKQIKNELTISNKTSNSQTLLLPYGIEFNDLQNYESQTTDSLIYLSGLRGQRDYQLQVQANVLVDYPELVNGYAEMTEAPKKQVEKKYLENEKNYNQFVYEHYLADTDKLGQHKDDFSKESTANEDHVYYEEADKRVADYFDSYQEKQSKKALRTPITGDFIAQHFNGERALSYDVEYATIGTLIYRSMGIPARYVEGYLVKPDTTKAASVTEKDAHAWLEIYQDGVGWVPKEPMPEYRELMPHPQFTGITHKGDTEKKDGQEDKEKEQSNDSGIETISEEEREKEKITRQRQERRKQYVRLALLVLLVLVSLSLLIRLIDFSYKRAKRARNERQLRNSQDNLTASLANFREVIALLSLDGIEIKGGSLYTYSPQIAEQYNKKYSRLYRRVVRGLQSGIYGDLKIRTKVKESSEKLLILTRVLVIENKPLKQRLKVRVKRFKNY